MQLTKTALAVAVMAVLSGVANAGDVSISGFLSAGGGVISEDDRKDDGVIVPYAGYGEESATFDADTLIGIQISGAISDKVTVTGQFVARGTDDYAMKAEWAYISYSVTDDFKFRIGRIRTPLYLYSDFVDVGYAYSWIRPPSEVYYLPFNNVQGIDFVWNLALGGVDATVQGYFGALTDEFMLEGSLVNTEIRDQKGLAIQLNRDWFTFRTAYHEASLSIDAGFDIAIDGARAPLCQGYAGFAAGLNAFGGSIGIPGLGGVVNQCAPLDTIWAIEDDKGSFLQAAIAIDTGSFIATAEHAIFKVDDSPVSDDIRSYVMVGWRFGDFLLHYTHSRARDEGKPELTENLVPDSVFNAGLGALPAPLQGALMANPAVAQLEGGAMMARAGFSGLSSFLVADYDADTIGLRWDFTSSVALKIEYQQIEDDVDGDAQVAKFAIQSVF